MRENKRRFLNILHVEIVDLREDLEWMIEESNKRLAEGRITERVHKENICLFQNELLGVEEFINIILTTEPECCDSLDDLISDLRVRFDEKIKAAGLAEAIKIYALRKIMKVQEYVLQPESKLHG